MDELIIGDKTYISSKRAAKITGYAKDYVGQLCREGRVEARLVGRNWYVLEASIMEHRFGAEVPGTEQAVVNQHDEVVAEEVTTISSWEPPVYKSEAPVMLPELTTRSVEPVQGTPRTPDASRQVVAEMQSAWQEWFKAQAEQQKALPDESPEFDGHLVPVVQHEAVEDGAAETTSIESAAEEVVIHRSYAQSAPPASVPHMEVEDLKDGLRHQFKTRNTAADRREGSSAVLKSLFVGVALVAVCVALVGSGLAGDVAAARGVQGGVFEVLRGSWEYKSIR